MTSLMTRLSVLPALLLSACAALPAGLSAVPAGLTLPAGSAGSPVQILTAASVVLSRGNYKIVRADLRGVSQGFSLLGIITLKPADYAQAMTDLYSHAGIAEGKPQALVNVIYQSSASYFILFSIPTVTVRADLIEFTESSAADNDRRSHIGTERRR
jgi:hypothetical protein